MYVDLILIIEGVVREELLFWKDRFIYFMGEGYGVFFVIFVVVCNLEIDLVLVFVDFGMFIDFFFIVFFVYLVDKWIFLGE